jgi:hypothetical protein
VQSKEQVLYFSCYLQETRVSVTAFVPGLRLNLGRQGLVPSAGLDYPVRFSAVEAGWAETAMRDVTLA